MGTEQKKIAAQNKKAFHDYFVIDRYEAGIELCGTEVKSIRQGKLNLKDSWCSIVDGELFVNGMHISPYEHGNIFAEGAPPADAQARDNAPARSDEAGGLDPRAAERIFRKRARKG